MNKYTKGPWRVDAELIVDERNIQLAVVETVDYDEIGIVVSDEECEANARLISSAPELLECLQFLVAVCETEKDATGIYSAHIEKARLAIAKAVQS